MDPQEGGRGGSYSTAPPVTAPLQPVLCSVPGDLSQEWHYLRTQVFPHLDALCQARGTCFRPLDTQWVDWESHRPSDLPDNSTSLSSQQLKISLDLITRSSSFLCLLGHRYGPFRLQQDPTPLPAAGPEREALSVVERNLHVAADGGYPWVLTGRNQTCSLTELQITQAALMGDTRHCFFYFRDYSFHGEEEDEDRYTDEGQRSLLSVFSKLTAEERHRARELKNRVVDSLQPVRFFRTLQDLGDLVKRDWKCLMEQLYGSLDLQPTCSGLLDSLDRCYHEGAVQALCRWFAPSTQTTAVMEALNTFTASLTHSDTSQSLATSRNSTIKLTGDYDKGDSEGSIFLLCGERGCGKSSLAARWLQEFRKKNPRIPAIPHFCGISSSSVDIRSVLRRITTELRLAHYGPQAEWSEGLQHHVKPDHVVVQAFSAAAALGPCVLVLDGLDRLTGTLGLSMQEVKDLCWLPDPLPPQCKILITATSTDVTYQRLTLRPDVHTLPWPGLSDPWVRRSVLLQHLTLPCQEPHRTLLQFILGTTTRPGMGRLPLFLAVVASELQTCRILRGKEEEEELIEEYVEVDSMAELWARVIQRWINDYGGVSEGTASQAKGTGGPSSQVSKIDLRGWVWDTLCLVHLSHAGLTEEQVLVLLEVLGYPGSIRVLPLEWARFRTAAGPWLQERPNGTLSLTHQSMGQAMDLLLLRVRPGKGSGGLRRTRRGYHLSLAQFFQRQGRELCSWPQILEELPWHLEQSEAWRELHTFFIDPQTVEHLSTTWSQSPQLRMDVVRYWTVLILRGYDPNTSYQSLLGKGSQPPTFIQSGRWAFPPATHTEQREAHSNMAFMTESQSNGKEDGCQWDPGVKGRVELLVSELLLCLNRKGEAERILLQSENTLTQAGEQDRDGESVMLLLTVRQTLAELYVETDQHREAETYCRSALVTAQTLTATCLERHERITVGKGQLLCVLCQLLFADVQTIEASQILSDIINMEHHKLHLCAQATVSLLCGIHRLSLQDPHGAEKHLQVSLETRRRWYGKDHPLVVEVEECLADILADTCADTAGLRQRLAVELYRHTVHVKDQDMKLCPPASPCLQAKGCSLAGTLVKLGRQIFHGSGKTESREAVELLQRALDLYIYFLGSDHTLTRDLQQVLNTESRRPLTPQVPRSTPLSHISTRRLSSGTRPNTAAPLHSHLAWYRGTTHTPLDPSVNRSLSAPSNKSRNTQPELKPEPVEYQNHNNRQNRRSSSPRTWSAFQTTVFGPQSDIRNLISELKPSPASAPGFRSIDRTRVLHRAGWCHLPGRYVLEERTVTALNREIGYPLHTQRCTPLVRQTGQGQGGEQSWRDRVSYSARKQ
ncbi:tetratricopeptide repeat protein 41-like isoform X2 [Oncorhynchus nerka]